MEWTTTERKIKCREGCEQKTKIKPARLQEKKREKEKWKIRKKYCSLPKLTHVAERMAFMFTLSQLATHSSMPPVTPHMLRWAFLRSKLNMKNHGGLTFSQMPGWRGVQRWVRSWYLINHTDKIHLPGCLPNLPQVSVWVVEGCTDLVSNSVRHCSRWSLKTESTKFTWEIWEFFSYFNPKGKVFWGLGAAEW